MRRILHEIATFQNGRAFRPSETVASKGLPIVKIAEMNKGITQRTGWFDGNVDPKHVITKGDLLFAWSGSIVIERWGGPDAVLNQHIFKVTAGENIDQRYLQFLLESLLPTFELLVLDQRTTMGHVKVADLKRIEVDLPELESQRSIAATLGALDDKIESNHRRVRLLLELARAEFSAMDREAARHSPMGEGYAVGLSGVWGVDTQTDRACVQTACFRGRDLDDYLNQRLPNTPKRFISRTQLSSRIFQDGEIWTAGSGTLGPSLLMGKPLEKAWIHPLTYSNFVKRLVPNGRLIPEVSWLALDAARHRGEFENFRTGTAMPNLAADAMLGGVRVPIVQAERSRRLVDLVRFALDPQPLLENEFLENLRDVLLPELLSGRLRIPEAVA